jgi:hypothetical protein
MNAGVAGAVGWCDLLGADVLVWDDGTAAVLPWGARGWGIATEIQRRIVREPTPTPTTSNPDVHQ